jgi:hypothetical protein
LGKENEESAGNDQNQDEDVNAYEKQRENTQDENVTEEAGFNRDNQEDDNQENDNAEENFIEEEEQPKPEAQAAQVKAEVQKAVESKEALSANKQEVGVEAHENVNKTQNNNNVGNFAQLSVSNSNNKVDAESQKHSHDVTNSSFNIQNEQSNKKNFVVANSFNEIVSANVQNFSFIGTNTNSTKTSSNVVSSNANLNLSSSSNSNLNSASNNYQTSSKQTQQQQYSNSPQTNVNNNNNQNVNSKNENKFNLPNFNQAQQQQQQQQNIPNLNLNSNQANQDLYNAYQMQMSSLLASQNMSAGLGGQQQVYPMPLFYYPSNGTAGSSAAADPSLNYSNFMPYMGYPMGYYMPQQQFAQQPQQNNLKDANDMQNKSRKMNTYVRFSY